MNTYACNEQWQSREAKDLRHSADPKVFKMIDALVKEIAECRVALRFNDPNGPNYYMYRPYDEEVESEITAIRKEFGIYPPSEDNKIIC